MIDLDIDRLMDEEAYPVLRIAGEFAALGKYLQLLDRFLPHIKGQTALAENARLRRDFKGLSRDDLRDYYDELEWVTESLVPRYFRGAYVLAVCAATESALKDLVNYCRKRTKTRLKHSDLKDRQTREGYELYLETLFREPLQVPPEFVARIDDLFLVRNCIAHANGDLTAERDEKRKKRILKLADRHVGLSVKHNELLLDKSFLKGAFESGAQYVNALISQMARVFPAPSKS